MPDTDHDGISDADELAHGTNPNSQDTDGDGWTDNVDWYPTEADHDHDGVIDGVDHDVAPPPGHSFWDDAARVATAVATGGASEVVIAAAGAVDPGVQQQVINAVTAPVAAAVDVAEAVALGASGDGLGAGNALLESVNDATFGGIDVNVAADGNVDANLGGHLGPTLTVDAGPDGVQVDAHIGANFDTDGDGDREQFGAVVTSKGTYDDETGQITFDAGVGEEHTTAGEDIRHVVGGTVGVDIGRDGTAGTNAGLYGETQTNDDTQRTEVGAGVEVTTTPDGITIDTTLGVDQKDNGVVTYGEHVGATVGGSYDRETGEIRLDTGFVEEHTVAGAETRNEAGFTMGVDVGVDGKVGTDAGVYAQTETDEHTVRDFAGTRVQGTDSNGERQIDATIGADQTVDGDVTTGAHVGTTIGIGYDDVTGEARLDAGVVEDHTIGGNETRNEAGGTIGVDIGVDGDGKAGVDAGVYAQTETDEHTVRDDAGISVDATASADGGVRVTPTISAEQTTDGVVTAEAHLGAPRETDPARNIDDGTKPVEVTATGGDGDAGDVAAPPLTPLHEEGPLDPADPISFDAVAPVAPTAVQPTTVTEVAPAAVAATEAQPTAVPEAAPVEVVQPTAPVVDHATTVTATHTPVPDAVNHKMDDITGVSSSPARPPAPTIHAASQGQADDVPVHHVEALPVPLPLPPSDDPVGATVGAHDPTAGDPTAGDPTAGDPTAADGSNVDDHNGVLDSVGDLVEEIIDEIHDAIDDLVN